ncbi:MAG TPA: putative lipid II flippase FtsW [Acidimicrobiales bacterium]|nr:putative lipid II flippase FtsW [Acidimicrobiales bacterium]
MTERVASARAVTRGRHPSTSGVPLRPPGSGPAPGPSGTRVPPPRPAAPPDAGGRAGWVARLGTRRGIAVLVGVLCVFGVVMVGSVSPVISLSLYGSPWAVLIRQLLWMGVGLSALLILARVDYHRWRALRGPLVVVSIGLLVVVLVPHLGVSAGGSSRWIGFGVFQLQPSELMKLALAVFAADLLTRRVDHFSEPRVVVLPVLLVLGVSGILILKQPDMGTALVLSCIAFGILFMGGVPMGPIVKVLGAFAVVAVVVGLADPYRRDRILSFLNPGAHQSGSGYQVWQSLIGLGSGHLFGLGLGGGRQKWGTLPNAHTDFIFSVVGEELGLVGAVLLLALFFALAWFGLRASIRAPDRFGSLLAVGITTWITSQAVINIGAVVGVLPVTGIPLPFISFGGSSLIITLAAVGILLNIAGHERSGPGSARRRRPAPER